MTTSAGIRTAIAVAIMVVLQYSVRPLLGWRADIDFLTIALLLIAVRVRPGAAAVAGCLFGLITDSVAPQTFGAGALAMTIVGFGASRLKAAFFADNIPLNGAFFFIGRWVFAFVYLLTARTLRGPELLQQLFIWSPLSAATTAICGIALLVLMRPLLEPAEQ